jgi:TIR domain
VNLARRQSWSVEIETHIHSSDAVVAILSRGSYVSGICQAEQLRALRQEKLVILVLVQKNAERPIHLETKQYIPFDDAIPYRDGRNACPTARLN